ASWANKEGIVLGNMDWAELGHSFYLVDPGIEVADSRFCFNIAAHEGIVSRGWLLWKCKLRLHGRLEGLAGRRGRPRLNARWRWAEILRQCVHRKGARCARHVFRTEGRESPCKWLRLRDGDHAATA